MPYLPARVLAKELGEAVNDGTPHIVKRNSLRKSGQGSSHLLSPPTPPEKRVRIGFVLAAPSTIVNAPPVVDMRVSSVSWLKTRSKPFVTHL
jgi:hypothetical protein